MEQPNRVFIGSRRIGILTLSALLGLAFTGAGCDSAPKGSSVEAKPSTAASAASGASQGGAAPAVGEVKPGAEAPAFTLKDLNGREVSLASFKGKTIVLNFWATWCVPCVTEMPALERLSKSFPGQPFEVVAVSVDSPEQDADVKKFVETNGLSIKILRDPDIALPQSYGVTGFPETFVIGPDGKFLPFNDPIEGKVEARVVGDRPWDSPSMVKAIGDLLKKPA